MKRDHADDLDAVENALALAVESAPRHVRAKIDLMAELFDALYYTSCEASDFIVSHKDNKREKGCGL